MIRKALKSKTVWLGILVAVLSAIQGFIMAIPLDPLQQALIGLGLSILIILLRFVTHGSINDK